MAWFHLCEISRIGNLQKQQNWIVAAYGLEGGRIWGVTAMGCEVSFCHNENVLKFIMVEDVQLRNKPLKCELKCVNCMAYESLSIQLLTNFKKRKWIQIYSLKFVMMRDSTLETTWGHWIKAGRESMETNWFS